MRQGKLIQIFTLSATVMALAGCGTITPSPLTQDELNQTNRTDKSMASSAVEPIDGPLTLDEAMARALKYNLDRRTRLMEEALSMNQLEMAEFDALPKLVAQAGYTARDKERATYSSQYTPNQVVSSFQTSSYSSERNHGTADLGLTWSLLDASVGYYGGKQQAERVLIAAEKRRKAMHVLMQDVRTAYWRAASAQQLRSQVQQTIANAESALADSRKVEAERVRNPMDALRYQRQLLENLRLLESIEQELASAQVDLAALVNAPLGQPITIAETSLALSEDSMLTLPIQRLEDFALENNADLREQHYNSRIARQEVQKTMARMFPNLNFNYGFKYDADQYLVHNNWNEAGLQLSFNLFNILTAPTQTKLAEAGVKLADQRRVASQMAVITQLHLARLQLINARKQFLRADSVYETDVRIASLVRSRANAQAQSKLDEVANDTAAILSLLRRYQALAQVNVAENRLIANLGLEPRLGSTDALKLKELTQQISMNNRQPWAPLLSGAEKP
ncbi:TolC family protein [Rhodoferax mekongensis]|uniref:TolC family protein n=1 Tax=Rhodoferax mekongensis TaxID=3068341 RepID=A0ABZ0AVT1_9BURK|nr:MULTISPECIES: TolC family protein [unclassified Rhodoferax]MDT7515452.1 TolC family protein [Rhodoferax sp. TBRC 17199]WNO03748.1 TolC family protein [Rhodoferax sp. TBRC 17307]